ncbi:MAG: class I SAM-dependent methyltransferase [Planctomycetaceae bacterium]|nr:class I SAM-dependent methyltransferase [Planctomycetaceae bacterium]
MSDTRCDLCGDSSCSVISDTDRHGQPLTTVMCDNCGLVRHRDIPSEEELREFYSTNYREEYNGERIPGPRRIMRAWNNGLRICRQISNHLPSGGSVFEVGAGIGCTVKVFERDGFAAKGIDPGGEFLKFSHDKLHADVAVGNLYDLPEDRSFDAVLLVHVIEHLRSPKLALLKIATLLKPGGLFYVECPNLSAPFARRSQLFHTAHIHNFVPATLRMLAESTGYRLRQRFGDERDPNLQMLFEYTGQCQLNVDPENVPRTLQELQRSDTLPYLARPRYLVDRARKLASYGEEHLRARSFVADLISTCQSAKREQEARRAA